MRVVAGGSRTEEGEFDLSALGADRRTDAQWKIVHASQLPTGSTIDLDMTTEKLPIFSKEQF